MDLRKSTELYSRTQAVLAGPSTFGKAVDQFAYGITPYSVERGSGAYVWDIDGNKYLDTMMALGAVLLGYCNNKVEQAVIEQIKKGASFSLAHRLETEVAEMLVDRIPCAEMVRFGKNGSDVTSAAVRLARHVTNKNHVLFCGYHGWQDWYISKTSMNSGIPSEVGSYSHRFSYNDVDSLANLIDEHDGDIACIIMEPVSRTEPTCGNLCKECKKEGTCRGFLHQIRDIATKNNIVLVFDEIVTGFRFHRGGYQAICGIEPDLACFSKAMGNGSPISALVGKRAMMEQCQEIFFSLTFAGEAVSLAATKAVLEIIDDEKVPDGIKANGRFFMDGVRTLIDQSGLNEVVQLEGFPCRSVLIFRDKDSYSSADIRTFWIQELVSHGVLTAGYHIISHSHQNEEISELLKKYNSVFSSLYQAIEEETLFDKLKCPPARESARSL
jgi:glutamate-1-semialdehyde 2,1-aminomutase